MHYCAIIITESKSIIKSAPAVERGRMMESVIYVVVVTRFDTCRKVQIRDIVGEFSTYRNARIFKDAYNKEYSANAVIIVYEEV